MDHGFHVYPANIRARADYGMMGEEPRSSGLSHLSLRAAGDEAISQFIDFSNNEIAALTATLRSRLTAHRNDKQMGFAARGIFRCRSLLRSMT